MYPDIITNLDVSLEKHGKILNRKTDKTGAEYIIDWLRRRMPEFIGEDVPATPRNRILIVKAETGSGKSFVMPVYLLRLLRGNSIPIKKKFTKMDWDLAGGKNPQIKRNPGVLSVQPRILTTQTIAENQ